MKEAKSDAVLFVVAAVFMVPSLVAIIVRAWM